MAVEEPQRRWACSNSADTGGQRRGGGTAVDLVQELAVEEETARTRKRANGEGEGEKRTEEKEKKKGGETKEGMGGEGGRRREGKRK